MKAITLYGAGGHSWSVVELIRSLEGYMPVAIVDDHPKCEKILGIPVCKPADFSFTDDVCISIGDNRDRKRIARQIKAEFPSFVHSAAQLYPSVCCGKGVQIFPGAVLDAAVTVGSFVIVNNNATISHQTRVGDFAHIAINAVVAGNVTIGEGCLVGGASVILPGIKLGAWSVIGAGAVVTRDVPDHSIVAGNPARVIKPTGNG